MPSRRCGETGGTVAEVESVPTGSSPTRGAFLDSWRLLHLEYLLLVNASVVDPNKFAKNAPVVITLILVMTSLAGCTGSLGEGFELAKADAAFSAVTCGDGDDRPECNPVGGTCGDEQVGEGEDCDDGNDDDTDSCVSCKNAVCGDGVILAGGEECDDGNDNDADACIDCKIASCGDGLLYDAQEECDDGNLVNNDGCSRDCDAEIFACDDGIAQLGEQCQPGESVVCLTSCDTDGIARCDEDDCTLGACMPPIEICNAMDDDCDLVIDEGCMLKLHRFYREDTNDHRYQASTIAPEGYVPETPNFWVYAEQVPGTVPLYQMVSPDGTDHMVSLDIDEADALDFTVESVPGYVIPGESIPWDAADKTATRVCRYFNSTLSDHLLETEAAEASLNANGYLLQACLAWAWDPVSG